MQLCFRQKVWRSWHVMGLVRKRLHFPFFRAYQKEINFNFIIRLSPSLTFNLPSLCTRHFFYSSRITDEGAASLIVSLCASDKYPFQSKPGLWTGCWLRVATQMPPSAILSDPKKKCWTRGLDSNEIYAPNTLVTAIKALKLKGKKAASVETVVWNLAFVFCLGGAMCFCVRFWDRGMVWANDWASGHCKTIQSTVLGPIGGRYFNLI